jgi:two-component system sporulation sensor kinase A
MSFIEELRDAFFMLDAEWRFAYVNRMAETVLDRPRDRLLGGVIWDEFPAAVGTAFEWEYRRVMEERVIVQFKEFYPEPLNRWYDVTASPYEEGITVHFRDITESKLELEGSRELYRSLFLHHPDGVGIATTDGAIVSVNASMVSLFGFPEEELLGASWIRLCPEENRSEAAGRFEAALVGLPQRFETYAFASDGRRLELHVTFVPIRVGAEVAGVFVLSKDITERKRAEEGLRQSEAELKRAHERLTETEKLFKLISENAQDAITVSSPDGVVQYISPGVSTLLGITPEEAIGRRRTDFYHAEDQAKIGVPDGQERYVSTNRIRRKDGSYMWIETSSKLVRDGTGRVVNVLGIGRDISERVKAEELMLKSEKLKLTGQLAAGIAHEIRNPLTAIKGFLQLMKNGYPVKQDNLNVMNDELRRIEAILNELLLLAKPNKTAFAARDLGEVLRHVATLMETEANMRDSELIAIVPPGETFIDCDENQLKQVFINFVKNGIEAMPQGGRLEIELARDGAEAVVTIADQGEGILPDVLARIGQPFFTTKEKGTGLGLAVSMTIVESHRGAVSFDSALGGGTIVTVRLPLLPTSPV